jgi:hypothetical protein
MCREKTTRYLQNTLWMSVLARTLKSEWRSILTPGAQASGEGAMERTAWFSGF